MDAALQRSLVEWAAANVEDRDLVDAIYGIAVFVDLTPEAIADDPTWPEIRYLAERGGAVRKSSLTAEEADSFREFLSRQYTETVRWYRDLPYHNPDETRVIDEVLAERVDAEEDRP